MNEDWMDPDSVRLDNIVEKGKQALIFDENWNVDEDSKTSSH